MRILVPAAARDAERLEEIRGSIEKLPGVLGVSANSGLSTLITHYDPAVLGRTLNQFVDKANRIIQAATGQAVNLKELFPFGIII